MLYHQLAYQSVIQSYAWLPTAIICSIGLIKYLVCYFGWRATAGRNRCLISLVSNRSINQSINNIIKIKTKMLFQFCTSLLFLIVIQCGLAGWTLVFRQDLHLESRGFVYQSFNQFIDSGQITDQNHVWNRMQADVRMRRRWECVERERAFVNSSLISFPVEMLRRPWNCRLQ